MSSRVVRCLCVSVAADGQVDDRLLAALRVMFSRSKQELEGKTAKQLGRYKVCNNHLYSPLGPHSRFRDKLLGI